MKISMLILVLKQIQINGLDLSWLYKFKLILYKK